VIYIGLKSGHTAACRFSGTVVMHATLNCCGTVDSLSDRINKIARGRAKTGVPNFRYHEGRPSKPVAVFFKLSNALKTVCSVGHVIELEQVLFS